MSQYGTSVTLRTVKSTAAKGDYFRKQNIKKMPKSQAEEMHRANELMDDLDRFFTPTSKLRELSRILEGEDEDDHVRM